jgi:hypothetical protein
VNLFDFLNQIIYYKQPWDTFTDDEKSEFNTYMIHRFISMNPDYIDIVNMIQKYPNCPTRMVYKFYCDLLPKKKSFFKYIKASGKNDSETIKAVAEYYQCSTREAKDYINIIDTQLVKNTFNLGTPSAKQKRRKKQ